MEDGLDGDTKQVAPFEPKSIHVLHWMHVDRIHISPLSLSVRRGVLFCFFLTETQLAAADLYIHTWVDLLGNLEQL